MNATRTRHAIQNREDHILRRNRSRIRSILAGAVIAFATIGLPITPISTSAAAATPAFIAFNPSGETRQQWVVPSFVTSVDFIVDGGSGSPGPGGYGGFGARVAGTLSVTPGSVLDIWVGLPGKAPDANSIAGGSGGWGGRNGLRRGGTGGTGNASGGNGGGGATEINAQDGNVNPSVLVIAAGGGGSGGYSSAACGEQRGGGCGTPFGGIGLGTDGVAGRGAGGGGGNASGGNGGSGAGGTGGLPGFPFAIGAGGAGGDGAGGAGYGGGGGGGGYGGGGGGGGGSVTSLVDGGGGGGSGRSLVDSTLTTGIAYGTSSAYQGRVVFTYSLSTPTGATRFVQLSPVRLLDTRNAADITAGLPVAAGTGIDLVVRGRGGVPASLVSAVVLNVTAVSALGPGFVTVWPSGVTRPTASNLNVTAVGQNIANLVTVKLGANGKVSLYAESGAHFVVDVAGYYESVTSVVAAGRYTPLSPFRILDTRASNGVLGTLRISANSQVDLVVSGRGGVPATGVSAVVLNVTVANATAAGFVTVWPTGQTRPNASNVNATFPGQNIANLVIVPIGTAGQVSLYTESGSHLIADVAGWFGDSTQAASLVGLFVPLDPTRILDTRNALGIATTTPILPNGQIVLTVAGRGGTPGFGVGAVVLNVTAANATGPGFVTVWPTNVTRPDASNLNITAIGQNIPNLASVALSPTGTVSLFTDSGTHLIADIAGYYVG